MARRGSNLADTRFTMLVIKVLSCFQSPSNMFESILYQPGVVDKFSVIVDDYVALENTLSESARLQE